MMRVVLVLLMLPLLCFSEMPSGKKDTTKLSELIGGSIPKERKDVAPSVKKYKSPDAAFKIQEVTGFYSEKRIKAVTDSNMLSLRSIHYKYLIKGLDVEGDVLLKFTISGSGEVSNVDILSSTIENAEFDEAIKNKVATWKWESTGSSKVTSVILLFKFSTLFFSKYKFLILSGPCPFMDVLRNINMIIPRFHNVYVAFYKLKSGFNGRIILKFTVAESGEITEVDIVASTTEYPEFDEAVKNKLAASKWGFKKDYSEKGSTTVIAQFSF